jgi:NADH-quinone oxidoreductase subunit L
LALAGIPPTAGFFSKDEVVATVLYAAPWAGYALLAASALTGAYIMRATRLAFFGSPRGTRDADESPWTMTVPLAVLAALALGLGFAGPAIAQALGAESEPLSLALAAVAVALACAGALGGWFVAAECARPVSRLTPAPARAWAFMRAGYGFDALVINTVVRPMAAIARAIDAVLDRRVIDGVAEGAANLARSIGAMLNRTMNGDGQAYSALLACGAIVLLAITIWLVR